MKKEEKYRRVVTTLKNFQPVLEEKQELTDEIMRSVRRESAHKRPSVTGFPFLFRWVGSPWLRLTMATFTVGFILVFSLQQMSISQRMNQLESQLLLSSKEITGEDPGFAVSQRILIRIMTREQDSDSITLSKSDLEELMNSYLQLKENYEQLKGEELTIPIY